MASDGLFDHLSDGEVCSIIDRHVKAGNKKEDVARSGKNKEDNKGRGARRR